MFDYDVIIVGAGPSGLATAYHLVEKTALRILVIEKGRTTHERMCSVMTSGQCLDCRPCNNTCGVGGAGGFYGGSLYFTSAGEEFSNGATDLFQPLQEVKRIFKRFGIYSVDKIKNDTTWLSEKCLTLGLHVRSYLDLCSTGMETSFNFTNKMTFHLERKGVEFCPLTEVESISFIKSGGFRIITKPSRRELKCKYSVLAVGKGGYALVLQLRRFGVKITNPQPYFGVRVETLKENFQPLATLGNDPKLYLYRGSDRIKTHCVTMQGYVISCKYDDFTLVDGFVVSDNQKFSSNTSFNVITRIKSPISFETAIRLISYINEMGKGKPLLQHIDDLFQGRPAKNRSKTIEPTLKSVTWSDINLAYPWRIIDNIKFFLKRLCRLIPIKRDALIYAPVAEWIMPKIEVDQFFQTPLRRLYVIGDGSGYTQGVVAACVTGLLAASHMVQQE